MDAFDWNLIARYALDVPAFHESFERLFAFGIDPPPGELPSDEPTDWPAITEVQPYQQRPREIIDQLLDDVPEQLLHVAVEHRLMHAETFAYILQQLDYGKKVPPKQGRPGWRPEDGGAGPTELLPIPAGPATLGLTPNGAFGWDNEFQAHTVEIPAFSVAQYKVTNGEYLEFVKQGADPPFFWADRGAGWQFRGMFSEYPLPLDAPGYVTHEQAAP